MSPLFLDISRNQNGGQGFTVDQFRKFADAGISRVIVKLGGSNNQKFPAYVETVHQDNARAAGLAVDGYWANGQATTPAQVAERIVGTGQVRPGEFLWWDVETWPNEARAWTPAEVVAYATALNAAGVPFARQGVYMSSSLTRSVDWSPVVKLGLRIWVADYGVNNGQVSSVPLVGSWPRCDMHQYTSVGRLPGYDASLDLNRIGSVWTVHALQQILNLILVEGGAEPLVIDGRLFTLTREAVRTYQKQSGMFPDGDPGTKTLTHLTERNGGIPVYGGNA